MLRKLSINVQLNYRRILGLLLCANLILLVFVKVDFTFALVQRTETLFEDDFESDTGHWEQNDCWTIRQLSDGNHVFQCDRHVEWIWLQIGEEWTNYEAQFRLKVTESTAGVQLSVRAALPSNYFLGLDANTIVLEKTISSETPSRTLLNSYLPSPIGDGNWHDVGVSLEGPHILVAIDGQIVLDYVDQSTPLLGGTIGFAALIPDDAPEGTAVQIDDVIVTELEPPPYLLDDGSIDKQALINEVQRLLAQGDGLYRAQRYEEAVETFQEALDLARRYKDHEAFANDRHPTSLHLAEFDALVGLGEATYELANQHYDASEDYGDYVVTYAGEVTTAENYLKEALAVAENLPDDPEKLGHTYFFLGYLYTDEGLRMYSTRVVDPGGWNWLNAQRLAQEFYGYAAEAFERAGNTWWQGEARGRQGWRQGQLGDHTLENNAESVEWYQSSIDNLRKDLDLRGTQSMWGGLVLDTSFRFSQHLESGTLVDETVNIDDLLREQIAIVNAIDEGYWGTNLYRGLANARLAWRTQDTSQAWTAVGDLLNGVSGYRVEPPPDDGEGWYLVVFTQHYLGRVYYMVGQPDQAAIYLAEANETYYTHPRDSFYKEVLEWEGVQVQYENYWMLGDSLLATGRYHEAVEAYKNVEHLSENPIYPDVMLGLSEAYESLGLYDHSEESLSNRYEYYKNRLNALAVAEQEQGVAPSATLVVEYQSGMIDSLLRATTPLLVLGRTEEAFTGMQNALDLAMTLDDRAVLVDTRLRMADIYMALGGEEIARSHYIEASALAQQAGFNQQRGRALLGLGQIQINQGSLSDARTSLYQALQAAQYARDIEGQVLVLTAQGDLELRTEEPDIATAERSYVQALNIANQSNDVRLGYDTLVKLGELRALDEDPLESSLTYYEALARAENVNDREETAYIHGRVGQLMATHDRLEVSDRHFASAIDLVEQTQRGFQSESLQTQFAANYAWIYAEYISLLFERGNYAEAFNVAERARARAFLDQLAMGPFDLREDTSTDLVERAVALLQQIEATRQLWIESRNNDLLTGRGLDENTIALAETLKTLEREYVTLFSRLQAENAFLSTLADVDVVTLDEVQEKLDDGLALLSYYTTDNQTYVFVVTKDDFWASTLAVSKSELATMVRVFQRDEKQPVVLSTLYQELISPIVDQIPSSARLIVIPHGVLHYLPFAALPINQDSVMGDQHVISYLPSASTLLYLPATSAGPGDALALTFGDDLTNGRQEIQWVVDTIGGEAFFGDEATEELVKERSSEAIVLHLAVHGEFVPRNPLFSALKLAPSNSEDGRLEVHEVYQLDLTKMTELVVLSACETGMGELSEGDEFTGMSRAFLYAGAPSVIASLWSVDDEATSTLMVEFYSNWAGGMDKAKALAEAQRTIRTNPEHPEWSAPYYWAAFVLIGAVE